MTNGDRIRDLQPNILKILGIEAHKNISNMTNDELVNYIGLDNFSENVCKTVCNNPKNCTDRICNCELAIWLDEE